MVMEEKAEEVKRISNLIEKYPTIGILDMVGMPSKQLQKIKHDLREKASIIVTKKSLLKIAIKGSKKEGLKELENFIPLQPGLVFTELEPFKFYSLVISTKALAFAREGDVAKMNVEIKAGPTNLVPGPVISELAKVKIPVGVEGRKIVIKKDVRAARAGEKISKDLASALKKLGIAIKEVCLNVVVLYSNGKIYGKDVLDLVGETSLNLLKEGFNKALNLSVAINYPTKENIAYLLAKAWGQAKFIESSVGG